MTNLSDIFKSIFIGLILLLISSFYYDVWSATGLGMVGFIFTLYILRLGKTIPLLELMLLISVLQWVFGAHQSYTFGQTHFKYYMYVERLEYMSVIVPGIIAFTLGVLLFYPKFNFQKLNEDLFTFVETNPKIPLVLILIGIGLSFFVKSLPPAFAFIGYLISNFKFVGATLWLFRPGRLSSLGATAAVLGLTFVSSIQSGLFHDLLLWGALLLSFVVQRFQIGVHWRIVLISFGFLLSFLIQSVKSEHREQIYSGRDLSTSSVQVFSNLVQNRVDNLGDLTSNERFLAEMNVRLNQGWIISSIIKNFKENETYVDGETIVDAIEATLLPRFLFPDKKIAGGRENFERFTGLRLHKNASMGVSIIGEAYANFGKEGSWLFMFFWGGFLAWGYGRLIKYGRTRTIIYAFVPLIFVQVIKAETELYVVLNHFIKSIILVFVMLWSARKILGWQI